MKVYHAVVSQEDEWYCARALEDSAVFTQARSLDELTTNIREVAQLLYDDNEVQLELIVPPGVGASLKRPGGRAGKKVQNVITNP
jgi:predicted RNase H-like HicB family nuclease